MATAGVYDRVADSAPSRVHGSVTRQAEVCSLLDESVLQPI